MPKLHVIYENKDVLVVNKAAGLISEESPYEPLTVASQVYDYLSKATKKPYVGVIHRLDRVTSGALIFAKKKSTLVAYNQLFSSRRVQKTYLAIVQNKPQKKQGNLVNFLVKNIKEKRADIVLTKSKNTQNCLLSYKILDQNSFGYLLEIQPKTGRFHQIRAQLAHLGTPIIGDQKYGSTKEYAPLSICLHAWKLHFYETEVNPAATYTAPLPEHAHWHFNRLLQ